MSSQPPRPQPPRPQRTRIVFGMAALVVLLHLAFAAQYGWFRDELYYVACGNRLAWGYVDHPPIVAFIARLAQTLFGRDSLVGLRLFAALAHGLTVFLTAEIARTMNGGRLAQTIGAVATALAPFNLVVGHIYTMNAFEPVVWGSIGLFVSRALRDEDAKPLIWLGPIIGLGILNKHSAAWPTAAFAIAITLSSSRRLLIRKHTLIAIAIATVIVAPHVVWQIANGFPTREFARGALSGKNEPYGVFGFIGQQIQLLHPLFAPLWIAGLFALFLSPALRKWRPVGIAYLLIAALIISAQAKAYYLVPAATWLFAAGSVMAERLTTNRKQVKRALMAYGVVAILGGLALIPAAIPVLQVPSFQHYAAALGGLGEQKSGEKMRAAALPQIYADMHGWREMALVVDGVVSRELSPEERSSDAVIFADNYGEASAVEHFGHSDVPVGSGNNGWWLWGPPRAAPSVLIAVGNVDQAMLSDLFEDVRQVATIDDALARADERDLPVLVCRRPKAIALREAWPRLKHYR